ncbi:RidA family protein [Methylobacterium sp. NPDC080182]|uniref:RidA family protein n=1 Tax=Methylobacterium sp. NPDC080182 TaxID=3390590 RepID=UPI003D03F4B9
MPAPQGRYVVAKRRGDLVFTAGMTPRRAGALILEGPVRSGEPLERYRPALILACSNALDAIRSLAMPGESVREIMSMTVFIAGDGEFRAHSQLADYASEYLYQQLGDGGTCTRAAVGVNTLPSGAPVELQLVGAIC